MRTTLVFVLLAFCLSTVHSQLEKVPVVVSTQWLADHLTDPKLVILHVGYNRPEYRAGHIPGARFLWYEWLTISTLDASSEMPSISQADSILEILGVSPGSHIVLCYAGTSPMPATRTYLALSYFGLGERVSILDGGYDAWKKEGRAISVETPTISRTSLDLRPTRAAGVDAEWIRQHSGDSSVAIVDVRDRRFYDGMGGAVSRPGHIKGALHLPSSAVLDSVNKFKNIEALRQEFELAGIKAGTTVVTYCHVGQQASVVYVVARLLGYTAAVYDGSFQEWNLKGEEYPVEK